jgi:hypothetical protein
MTIHDKMRQQCQLARTYAEDGAFNSAARVLRDLAIVLEAHAKACDPAYRPSRHIDNGPESRGERSKVK